MLFEAWLFLEINWIVYINRCCFIKLDIWEQSVYTARHNLVYWGLSMKKIIMCLVGLPVCQDPIFLYSSRLKKSQVVLQICWKLQKFPPKVASLPATWLDLCDICKCWRHGWIAANLQNCSPTTESDKEVKVNVK